MKKSNSKILTLFSFAIIGLCSFLFWPLTIYAQQITTPKPSLILETSPIDTTQKFNTVSGPRFLDVDFDGFNELLISGGARRDRNQGIENDTRLYIYHLDGTFMGSDNKGILFANGIPSFATMNPFGELHEVAVNGNPQQNLLKFNPNSQSLENLPGWPQTNGKSNATVMADLNGDAVDEYIYLSRPVPIFLFLAGYADLNVLNKKGERLTPSVDLQTVQGGLLARTGDDAFAIGDLDSDGKKEIILSVLDKNRRALLTVHHDGTTSLSSPLPDDLISLDTVTIGKLSTAAKQGHVVVGIDKQINDFDSSPGIQVYRQTNNGLVKNFEWFGVKNASIDFPPIIAKVDPTIDRPEILVVEGVSGLDEFNKIGTCSRIHAFLADTNGGNIQELSSPWPIVVAEGACVTGQPVVGNIDGDGTQEIVVSTNQGIQAFHLDGSSYAIVNGQQEPYTTTQKSSNNAYKVIEIAKPGYSNIAVFFDRLELEDGVDYVYIFPGDVSLPDNGDDFDLGLNNKDFDSVQEITGYYRGWSASVPGPSMKIVLRCDEATNLFGYTISKTLNGTSQPLSDFIPQVPLQGSPLLADVNKDGLLDLSFADKEKLYMVNLNVPFKPEKLEWPMYRHDPKGSNAYSPPQPWFLRGDVNNDGEIDLVDAIKILLHLFLDKSIESSLAADTNDDGTTNLSDAIYLLEYLYRGGKPPPLPFPVPGPDPSS